MIIFLLCLVLFANITVLLGNKKNNKFIIFFSVIFIILLMGGCTNVQDYYAYKSAYENNAYRRFEPLYSAFANLIHSTGASFQVFMAVYMFTGIYLGIKAIKNFNANYHAIIILYLATTVYINTCVLRQFMSYAIYMLALCELSNGKRLKYCIMILTAAAFHVTALIALPLVFFSTNRNTLREMFILILFLCIATFFNSNRIPGIDLLIRYENRIAGYTTTSTNLGFTFCFLLHFTLIFIAERCVKYLQGGTNAAFVNTVLSSTFYFTLALPLCMHTYTFIRIIYFNFLPVIMSMSIVMKYNRRKFLFYAVMLILIFEFTSTYGTVRELVLNNNIITAP